LKNRSEKWIEEKPCLLDDADVAGSERFSFGI